MMFFRPLLIMLFSLFMLLGCKKPPSQTPNYFATTSGSDVKPGSDLSFPRDHGPHNEQGIEWWYITANLADEQGNEYGVQWTLFRIKADNAKVESPWWDNNFYFAHFAIESDEKHLAFERSGRSGQVNIVAHPFSANIDDWSLKSKESTYLPLKLTAKESNASVALTLDGGPMILHGENGYSQKTPEGNASYYYSFPLLNASGQLTLNGKTVEVKGSAWLDREWSGGLMGNSYAGWDWFSIQANDLKSGLMAFCLRDTNQEYKYCSGTKFDDKGKVHKINNREIKLAPTSYSKLDCKLYPIAWQLHVKDQEPVIINSVNKDSRNRLSIPYWEGRIKTTGAISGKGYVELVGYE